MGQVEFQHEPLLSGAAEPLVADFPPKVESLSSNPETDSVDVNSVLNSEGVLVIDSEYSGWEPDSDYSSSYDQKNPSRFRRVMSKVALPAAGVISSVAIACGGGDGSEVTVTPTSTPTSEQTTVSEETPTQTPTATATEAKTEAPTEEAPVGKPGPEETATASPTEENTPAPEPTERVQEIPCQIVPEEFCNDVEALRYITPIGENVLMIGFKNLPAGTPIMAPVGASVYPVRSSSDNSWKGNWALVDFSDNGTRPSFIIGDIGFESPENSLNVEAGGTITTIQGNGVDNEGYNLLIMLGVQEFNGGELTSNNELYESLFPGITSVEPVGVLESTESEVVLTNNVYVE